MTRKSCSTTSDRPCKGSSGILSRQSLPHNRARLQNSRVIQVQRECVSCDHFHFLAVAGRGAPGSWAKDKGWPPDAEPSAAAEAGRRVVGATDWLVSFRNLSSRIIMGGSKPGTAATYSNMNFAVCAGVDIVNVQTDGPILETAFRSFSKPV